MVVNVLSLFFTGELVNKISELVAKLDWEKVKEAISEIPGAIWEDFTGKWNSPNKTDAAEFRGKVIGYIIAEVVLAILTAGILTEVKWVSFVLNKLGKAGEEILMLINKAREVIGKEARAAKYADELERLRRAREAKKDYNITAKINKQINKRGWTDELIKSTRDKPFTTRTASNKATGNKATAYFNKDGSYIVIDDVTKDIIQVSDRTRSWVPDPTIINPYIPK